MDLIYESYQILESTEREYTDIIINEGFDKERIKEWIKNAWEKVKKFLSNVKKYIIDAINKVKNYFKTKYNKTPEEVFTDVEKHPEVKKEFSFHGYNFKNAKYDTSSKICSECMKVGKIPDVYFTEKDLGIDKTEDLRWSDIDWGEVCVDIKDESALKYIEIVETGIETLKKRNLSEEIHDPVLVKNRIEVFKEYLKLMNLGIRGLRCHMDQSIKIFAALNNDIKTIQDNLFYQERDRMKKDSQQ